MSNSSNGTSLVRTGPAGLAAGVTATETALGERTLARSSETAITAAAEQARATIQAMFIVAQQRPRNITQVRERIMSECLRPGFAKVARFKKPIGGGKTADGPSIRFAESALRAMGNIRTSTPIVSDDEFKRMIHVLVTDLETNTTFESEVLIEKEVERTDATGRIVVGSRLNSRGQTSYRVAATEDEVKVKQNAEISKALRTTGLRLIPGDIVDDCMRQVMRTLSDANASDPEQAKKDLADAFFDIGVKVAELEKYIGHELGTATPDEIDDLWAIGASIRDKETTWREVLAMKASDGVKVTEGKPAAAAQIPAASTPTTPADALRTKMAGKQGAKAKLEGLLAALAKVERSSDAVATWWNENEPVLNDLPDADYQTCRAAAERQTEPKL